MSGASQKAKAEKVFGGHMTIYPQPLPMPIAGPAHNGPYCIDTCSLT